MSTSAGDAYNFARVFEEELYEIDRRRAGVFRSSCAETSMLEMELAELADARRRQQDDEPPGIARTAFVREFYASARVAERACVRAYEKFKSQRTRNDDAAVNSLRGIDEPRRELIQSRLRAERIVAMRRRQLAKRALEIHRSPCLDENQLNEQERKFRNHVGTVSQAYGELRQVVGGKAPLSGIARLLDECCMALADNAREPEPRLRLSHKLRFLTRLFAARESGVEAQAWLLRARVHNRLVQLASPAFLDSFRWAADSTLSQSVERGADTHSEPNEDPATTVAEHATEGIYRRLTQLRTAALKRNLVGLALSGGGIRSATVGLGFLQGLAHASRNFSPDCKLLKQLDYLSTVSGGGYIAGWLAAWIKREGEITKDLGPEESTLQRIEQQLEVNRYDQRCGAAAAATFPLPPVVRDDEPGAIYHLRKYSNYLTPRAGILSVDTWTAVGTYVRNLFLTSFLVLTPLFLAVLLFVQSIAAVYSKTSVPIPGWGQVATVSFGITTTCILSSVIVICLCIVVYSLISGHVLRWVTTKRLCNLIVWLATGLAMNATWTIYAATSHGGPTVDIELGVRIGIGLIVGVPTLVACGVALIQRHRQGADWDTLWGLVRLLIGVSAAAGAIWASAKALPEFAKTQGPFEKSVTTLSGLHDRLNAVTPPGGASSAWPFADLAAYFFPSGPQGIATVGPPLVLLLLSVAIALMIGLSSWAMDRYVREWWASLAGRLLLAASLWLVVFGLVLYGPWIFLDFHGPLYTTAPRLSLYALYGLLASWGGTTLAGLAAANGPLTGTTGTTSRLEILARLAPFVCLVGLIILGSCGARWLPVWIFQLPGDSSPKPQSTAQWWQFLNAGLWGRSGALTWGLCLTALGLLLGYLIDPNRFSLHEFYGLRLIRCYLGASRGSRRAPDPTTDMDRQDDLELSALRVTPVGVAALAYSGPYPLINTAMNLVKDTNLAWQERKAEAFLLSPAYCGSKSTGYCTTREYAGDMKLGTAVAISGAAVSPNMGYHSSGAVSALLTVFNVRLGRWLGNPRCSKRDRRSPGVGAAYLVNELLGRTTNAANYIYLSDGGHFENLGVYELIRRRCRYVVMVDSGQDGDYKFEDLGNLIRKVRIDFGIRIEIDPGPLVPNREFHRSDRHVVVGKIFYSDAADEPAPEGADSDHPRFTFPGHCREDEDDGVLIYVKPSLTGDEPADVRQYAAEHPKFPHDPTADQWFTESQFESYRALGFHMAGAVFEDAVRNAGQMSGSHPGTFRKRLFKQIFDLWLAPPPDFLQRYRETSADLKSIQQALRCDTNLRKLSREVLGDKIARNEQRTPDERRAERHMLTEMLTVLEDSWFRLDLKRWKDHPKNKWWRIIANRWTKCRRFPRFWKRRLRKEFSRDFREYIDKLIK